jgi:hypothetical protein
MRKTFIGKWIFKRGNGKFKVRVVMGKIQRVCGFSGGRGRANEVREMEQLFYSWRGFESIRG